MMKARVASSMPFGWQRWLCFALAVVFFNGTASAEDAAGTAKPGRRLGEIDIVRIQELYHITDTFGEAIWPGFDTRKISIAINNDNREELLIGHPNPPKEFHPFKDFELNGQPVMIRDGVTRYGPKSGGWATDIGGEHSVYVSTLKKGRDTDGYLSLILHECFHCFQDEYRQRADGAGGELPEDDPVYSAMIGLESRILKATLDEPSDEKARELAEMFVAVRHERRKDLPENVVILEGEEEYNEGTASYSQARMYQLLIENGGIEPKHQGKDPQYHGFPNARREYERKISEITRGLKVALKGWNITFFHSKYRNGMAQCLVLDRVRPGWKEEMRQKGMTQFALMEKEFPLEEEAEKRLLAEARKRFDYEDLLSEQKRLVDERLDLIRGYVGAPGRRYRVYHHRIPGRPKWKPFGLPYHVPESLEKELAEERRRKGQDEERISRSRTVWAGGIRRFEKEGLVFESGETPVIFGGGYLEWIDRNPAADQSDMKIESEKEENGTHFGVKITTDGFTLEAKKARIEWSKDMVQIYPMPKW